MPATRVAVRRRADRTAAVTDPDALTPVEWYNGIAYKRDDLFLPFADIDLNGGKVRQALKLVGANLPAIRRRHNGTLLTATGVHSPQGLIIARVAAHYDLGCRLFIGATSAERALDAHRMLRTAATLGASIDADAPLAYETVLAARIDSWQRRFGGFPIRFGMNLDADPEAIIGSTAAQCRNIPADVDTVVIPTGSGITAAGIIDGIRGHCGHVDRIICVQIAGYDRRPVIDRITRHRDYEFVTSRTYPYARLVRHNVTATFPLDPVYEAKAHEHMRRHLAVQPGRTLFWVVGDSTYVR